MCRLYEHIKTGLESDGSREAFIDSSTCRILSFNDLKRQIAYHQHLLFNQSIKQGDKIALIGNNSIEWAIAYLAVTLIGAVVVPISKLLTNNAQNEQIKHCEAKLILTDFQHKFQLPSINLISSYEKAAYSSAQYPIIYNENVLDTDLQSIVYTSGTSSESKGVMLSYLTLSRNIEHAISRMPLAQYDTTCSFMPFDHSLGCMYCLLYPLAQSATNVIVSNKFSIPSLVKIFQKYSPQVVYMVPLICEKILELAKAESRNGTSLRQALMHLYGDKLKEVIVGGAALDSRAERTMLDCQFPIGEGYGMTECGPIIAYSGPNERVECTVGKIVDHLQYKIDSSGELLLKGDSLFLGYFKQDQATQNAFYQEWFKTGDIVELHQGCILIKGRTNNVFIGSNGLNIYPEEIEAEANKHPHVLATLAICNKLSIDLLVHPDQTINNNNESDFASSLLTNINANLPKYEHIHRIIIRYADFERTSKKSIKRYLYT